MSLESETISQLVGVMLMLAPSSSDNHLENFSQPLLAFETVQTCQLSADSLNQQQIQTFAPDTNEITTIHAWCKTIWKD